MRTWFAALSTVSPSLAAAHASRIFFTPHRRTRSAPGAMGGVEPAEFRVRSGRDSVVGWSYGSGPAVLMVHGWGGSSADWSALAPLMITAGYRVVMFDFPAHGVSSGARTALPDMVRALHSVAYELAFGPGGGFAPVEAVVAHSFGGAAAVLAAREGLLARRLVLVNPVGDPMSFAEPVARELRLNRATRAGMLDRIRIRAGGDLRRIDVVRAATDLPLPGLVIHDRDDARVPYAQGRAIARAWPNARFVTTEGMGHKGALSSDAVLGAIAAFAVGEAARETAAASV